MSKKIKLKDLTPNPDNPRTITEDNLRKLKDSLKDFKRMMSIRPIIVDEDGVILGGNMRYQGLKALGYSEVPNDWVKVEEGLNEDEKREFIIKDNIAFGSWDWDVLANEWDSKLLNIWNLNVWSEDDFFSVDEEEKEKEGQTDEAKPLASADGFSTFELVMTHENKVKLVDGLNAIREEKQLERLEDALIVLLENYNI